MSHVRQFDGRALPQVVLYAKSGVVPYLSWNFIRCHRGIIYQEEDADRNAPVFLTMTNLVDLIDLYEKTKKLKEDAPMLTAQPFLSGVSLLVSIFDPLESYHNFKSTPTAIPFQSHQGKRMVTVAESVEIVKRTVAPAYMQSLADLNAPPEAGNKWTAKTVERSQVMLAETMKRLEANDCVQIEPRERHNSDSKKLAVEVEKRQPQVFGSITGGYSEKARLDSCKHLATHAELLAGVVIESFYGYHKERDGCIYFEDVYTTDVDSLLRKTIIPNLPANLPRALFGVFLPDDMLRLIAAGVDLLDTSICTLLTRHGMALPSPLIDRSQRRLRFTRMTAEEISEHSGKPEDQVPETIIDLRHVGYVRDANAPVSATCKCYVCTAGFSRAYLNHMLKRHELNGSILLQIHNHYAITEFIADVREIVAEVGQLDILIANSNLTKL